MNGQAVDPPLTQSIATIAFVEVAESVRLVCDGELAAVQRIRALLSLAARDTVPSHQGQVIERQGDGLLLERALGNLVHNALWHPRREGRTGGHVAVVLTASGGGFALRVLDDGDGVSDAGLEELRRGVPTDARTRTVGFGLDVVRRVADLHGLRLDVEHGQDGGLTFTLQAAASGPPRPPAAVGPA